MSDPRRYTLTITGLTPIMFNRYPSAEEEAEKKSVRDKTQFERDHVRNRLYLTKDGEVYVPASAIKKALKLACAFVPEKPKGSFKSYGPMVEGVLFMEDDMTLNVDLKNMVRDERPVKNQGSKGSVIRVRPLFPVPWGGKTSCLVVDDGLGKDMLTVIADRAGRLVGIMEGRKGIDMGRCQIEVKNGSH